MLLRELVDVKRQTGPEVIEHYNLQRTIDVLSNVAGNDLGRVAGNVEAALSKLTLPDDVTLLMKGEVDGMRAALKGFGGVLPMAMVLIYLVMLRFSLFILFVNFWRVDYGEQLPFSDPVTLVCLH